MQKAFVLIFLASFLFIENAVERNGIWQPLKPFIGTWIGEGEGTFGKAQYEMSYAFILNKKFIEIHIKANYLPSDKFPKGETHDDLGYFSYDVNRHTFILSQYHMEGFTNQLKLDSISPDQKTMVFTTQSLENFPKGWRGKDIYRVLNENEIEETIQLAEPNKDFTVYSKVKLRRKS